VVLLKNVRQDSELRALYERARCVFFDCDGVIFDSNGFKIEGMRHALSDYDSAQLARMEEFWRANGGVSRYEKFRHFFSQIAPDPDVPAAVRGAAERFGVFSRAAYTLHAPVPEALELARHAGRERCYVVSGADESELVSVFAEKGIAPLFAGVHGSPRPKLELITTVLERLGAEPSQALLIGDGAGDFRVATTLGMRFVYLAQFSEWRSARERLDGAAGVTWADDWTDLRAALIG
jgi:phosphoglycolate phosphatase-like HAD superfamily hydrolase